jgi:hypothetical protein
MTVDGERTVVVGAGIAERMQIESCRILPSGWPCRKRRIRPAGPINGIEFAFPLGRSLPPFRPPVDVNRGVPNVGLLAMG